MSDKKEAMPEEEEEEAPCTPRGAEHRIPEPVCPPPPPQPKKPTMAPRSDPPPRTHFTSAEIDELLAEFTSKQQSMSSKPPTKKDH